MKQSNWHFFGLWLLVSFFNALSMVWIVLVIVGLPALVMLAGQFIGPQLGWEVSEKGAKIIYLVALFATIIGLGLLWNNTRVVRADRLLRLGRYEEARVILEEEHSRPKSSLQAAKWLADLYSEGLGGPRDLKKAVGIYDGILLGNIIRLQSLFGRRDDPPGPLAYDPIISDALARMIALAGLEPAPVPSFNPADPSPLDAADFVVPRDPYDGEWPVPDDIAAAARLNLAFWYLLSPRAWTERAKTVLYLQGALDLGHPEAAGFINSFLTKTADEPEDPEIYGPIRQSLEELLKSYAPGG